MDYSKVLELDNIALLDCVLLFGSGIEFVINDGRIVALKETNV